MWPARCALESGLVSPLKASAKRNDNVLESTLRSEVFEELGIEIEILRLLRMASSIHPLHD
jgi:ADP-ribose pyrophosphatase YjhB (NUDIX family)